MPSIASKPAVGNPAVSALVRGLAVGLLGKGAFALVPPLLGRKLPSRDATVGTLRFAAFMALWCGGTRAVLRALVRSARDGGRHSAGAAVSALSAAVAGGSLMLATPGDRRMMGLWVGVRGAAALVRLLAEKGWIPSLRHPSLLVMMFIAAMLMHSLIYTPGRCGREILALPRGGPCCSRTRVCIALGSTVSGDHSRVTRWPERRQVFSLTLLRVHDAIVCVGCRHALRLCPGRVPLIRTVGTGQAREPCCMPAGGRGHGGRAVAP